MRGVKHVFRYLEINFVLKTAIIATIKESEASLEFCSGLESEQFFFAVHFGGHLIILF